MCPQGDLSAARSEVLLASEALTRERHEASVLRSRIESVDAKLRHALGEAAQREEALQHEVRTCPCCNLRRRQQQCSGAECDSLHGFCVVCTNRCGSSGLNCQVLTVLHQDCRTNWQRRAHR